MSKTGKMRKEFSILIAEDDPGHFELIRKNLSRMGFRSKIERFADGQAILDFLFANKDGLKHDPSRNYLILLDIRMPKVDGIEVLRQIKADEELSKIPVVMLTTTDAEADMEKCRQLGCIDYIVKPVNKNDFAAAIHKVGLSLLLSVVEMSHIGAENNPETVQ